MMRATEMRCRVAVVEGKGRGVLASRKISVGETVLRELPAACVEIEPPEGVSAADPELYAAEQSWRVARQLAEAKSICDAERNLMPHDDETHPIFEARRRHLDAGVDWIMRKCSGECTRTKKELKLLIAKVMLNSFHMPRTNSQGVFTFASMFNHSNRPALAHYFDQPSNAIVVRAVRDIEEGEEMCIAYVELLAPLRSIRLELKAMYFFDIGCDEGLADDELDAYCIEGAASQDAISRIGDTRGRVEAALGRLEESRGEPTASDVVVLLGLLKQMKENRFHPRHILMHRCQLALARALACLGRRGQALPIILAAIDTAQVRYPSKYWPRLGPMYKMAYLSSRDAGNAEVAKKYKDLYHGIQRVVLGMNV